MQIKPIPAPVTTGSLRLEKSIDEIGDGLREVLKRAYEAAPTATEHDLHRDGLFTLARDLKLDHQIALERRRPQ